MKKHSDETKKKISDSLKGDKCYWYGKVGTRKGVKLSDETKHKMSLSHKGKKQSDASKLKIRNSKLGVPSWASLNRDKMSKLMLGRFVGKKHTEEFKKKCRIRNLKKIQELGIPQKSDRGSERFFEQLNGFGFDFKPKRFFDIGYDADGYDEHKHIWCEFDTPYHNTLSQKKKDVIRQNNIINFFESNGTPLKEFVRVTADKNGIIQDIKSVL